MEKLYDYLVVGSGLFGATFTYFATKAGKRVLVIEKRDHIGGNIYTESICDINVHKYGAHIFHTSNKEIWDFINTFARFNNFKNNPIANYKGTLYHLPFNMYTFSELWGVKTANEAKKIIKSQSLSPDISPSNLEERALQLVGRDIYEKLIKGYTQKQWGRDCQELPAFILNRIPCRFTYDNNYYNDVYQGIPIGGYTHIIEQMLCGADIITNTDFFSFRKNFPNIAKQIVFTGQIDEYFGYRLGHLQYRSLRFESKILDTYDFQGVAVMNFTDSDTPYTRIIEHKHFESGTQPQTVITKEFPAEWHIGDEPYYPINDNRNNILYKKYRALAEQEPNIIWGGRLGQYQYLDMDKTIESAFEILSKLGLKQSQ